MKDSALGVGMDVWGVTLFSFKGAFLKQLSSFSVLKELLQSARFLKHLHQDEIVLLHPEHCGHPSLRSLNLCRHRFQHQLHPTSPSIPKSSSSSTQAITQRLPISLESVQGWCKAPVMSLMVAREQWDHSSQLLTLPASSFPTWELVTASPSTLLSLLEGTAPCSRAKLQVTPLLLAAGAPWGWGSVLWEAIKWWQLLGLEPRWGFLFCFICFFILLHVPGDSDIGIPAFHFSAVQDVSG